MPVGCRWSSVLVFWVVALSVVCGLARAASLGQIAEFPTDDFPQGLVSGPDGNLWFHAGLKVDRITRAGHITKFGGAPPLDVGSSNIVTGPDGNLWFTLWGEGAVGRITPAGRVTEFSVRNAVPGSEPELGGEIVPGADGNLWFADFAGAIGRITPSGQITEFSA